MTDQHNKVGTALKGLIPEWLASGSDCQTCKQMAEKMDGWGVDGCKGRRAEIVDHLVAQSREIGVVRWTVPERIIRRYASDMLDHAIQLASSQ